MELGTASSSSTSNSSSSSVADHSLNGLKFGQKIYFEDHVVAGTAGAQLGKSAVSAGGAAAAGGSSSSSGLPPPPTPAKKGRSGAVQGGQRPRCQVEGCQVDLSDAKAYYSRHKVCGMHSKSPKVIVAGLEQRFCQQCSRFHQLPEFDQAKRSCRRRLAGHNERRRKPPPGSISSPHYGSLSSSIFETSSRGGGFLMDFSAYPNLTGHDSWPNARASDHASNNHSAGTGKFLQPWHSNSESPPSDLLLQGSVNRTGFPGPGIPSGDCFTGVSDSSRALSLLSNQPWCSRNRPSSLGANNMLNSNGTPVVQPSGTHGAPISHFSSPSWGFKGNEATSSSSHEMPPGLGLGPISQPPNCQYPGELEMAQQSGRQYLELDQSRGYDSSVQHMHWSL